MNKIVKIMVSCMHLQNVAVIILCVALFSCKTSDTDEMKSSQESIVLQGDLIAIRTVKSTNPPIVAALHEDGLKIDFNYSFGSLSVAVMDSQGDEVYQKTVNATAGSSLTIDTSDWECGEYTIVFCDDTGKTAKGKFVFENCKEMEDDPTGPKQMTMTTDDIFARITMAGTGEITIDWGDGSKIEKNKISEDAFYYDRQTYEHAYSDKSDHHTITVTGENITHFSSVNTRLTSLDVSKNIVLTYLRCSGYSQITNLDVSKNTALSFLDCGDIQLKNLKLGKNSALTNLICWSNQLTSLDVTCNPALKTLNCGMNQLTELNVSRNTALKDLCCYFNQLSELNVSSNIALTVLLCNSNQLKKIDVSKNTALASLWCQNNQLTDLSVVKNNALENLWCSDNQLTNLDLSKNTQLIYVYCQSNRFTTETLNTLFGTLHNNTFPEQPPNAIRFKQIFISNNPGTMSFTHGTVLNNGWYINTYER